MKCPICQWETKEENPRFCVGCGWEFKLFLSDVGEVEKAAYAERVAIARKNWAELQKFRAGKKAAPEAPKETGSAGSPSEAKVPELTRDPFETAAEFEKRINDTPAIPAGTGRLIREEYDIDSGRFPVKVEWWEWAKGLPGLPKDGDGLHVVAKRDLAKAIYESGPEHGISVKLKALDGKAGVDGLVLLTDKGPIPVKRPSPEAEKRISGPLPGMEFVWIPPGEFWMGQTEEERKLLVEEVGEESYQKFFARELPRHRVTLTRGFYLQTTPVTVAQWKAFHEATGYRTEAEHGDGAFGWTGSEWKKQEGVVWKTPGFFQPDDHPVTCVSWNDAAEFLKWMGKQGGLEYGLPTEAEWEYACRAGTETLFWNGRCLSTDQANYDGNYPLKGCPKGKWRETTTSVKMFPTNPWALHDMHGNVLEWCRDWFGEYPVGPVIDPTGPETGAARVLRGGGWDGSARDCRAANRGSSAPDNRGGDIGIRVVGRRAQY